jgi:ABC-type Na+ transport system ATPase subunit NatA
MSVITVEHLHKAYGRLGALRDVSFEVAAGQVVALLGPNGAGKTTTMELLEGYQTPSGGVVRVLGSEPRRAGRAWRARVGLVLQSTSLDLQLTVREALGVHAGLFPRPWPVGELLELVDLAAEADTRIGQLSGGQRRRVDVGLGIVGRPELLFLDEPTTGLDPVARRQAWTAVERLTAAGTTVVLTTHYLEEAQRLADRVLVPSSPARGATSCSCCCGSPRALWAGVLLPVMLLVLTNLQQPQVAAASLAGRVVLGVTSPPTSPTPPAWSPPARPGSSSAGARPPSPAGATWPGGSARPSCWPWPRGRSRCWSGCSSTTPA